MPHCSLGIDGARYQRFDVRIDAYENMVEQAFPDQ